MRAWDLDLTEPQDLIRYIRDRGSESTALKCIENLQNRAWCEGRDAAAGEIVHLHDQPPTIILIGVRALKSPYGD